MSEQWKDQTDGTKEGRNLDREVSQALSELHDAALERVRKKWGLSLGQGRYQSDSEYLETLDLEMNRLDGTIADLRACRDAIQELQRAFIRSSVEDPYCC